MRQLSALIAIAEEGTFSAAARRINLSQPALSLLIKQLEERLDIRLFHRTTRKVELSSAGRELLLTARRVIADLENGIAQLRDYSDLRRGRVTVGALPSLASTLLAEAISGFRAEVPGVRVSVHDGVAKTIIEDLKAGQSDFVLGLQVEPDDDLISTHLLMDELVAIAHLAHLAVARSELGWSTLAKMPLIAMARGTSIRQLTDRTFTELSLAPEPAYEVAYMSTAMALVLNGEGVAVLPSSALPAVLPMGLRRLALRKPRVQRQICILERRGRSRSPASDRLITHLLSFTARWRRD